MNQHSRTTAILVISVILCSALIIGSIWGLYFFDHAIPNDTSSTEQSESSSYTDSEEQTTAPLPPENTKPKPKKMIALTFDDGPSGAYTHKILDLLEQYQAKATFFVCGYQLKESKKDELQRAISLGCEIGNHSETHAYLTKISEEELLKEIRNTNEKIAQLSGTDYHCTVYRPPYGSVNRKVAETLIQNEIYMYPILWNSDSRDWEYRRDYDNGKITRNEAITGTFETVVREASEGSVILMHDIQSITPDVVALILEKYTAEGYTFVTVSELFGFEEMQDEEAYFKYYNSANSISSLR
ncbi:MAG: polysaccharide deacetylase family protein [Clostridia bacterium]|nr:polysaccharide deacetylase family protein [Clostridia bacterium]